MGREESGGRAAGQLRPARRLDVTRPARCRSSGDGCRAAVPKHGVHATATLGSSSNKQDSLGQTGASAPANGSSHQPPAPTGSQAASSRRRRDSSMTARSLARPWISCAWAWAALAGGWPPGAPACRCARSRSRRRRCPADMLARTSALQGRCGRREAGHAAVDGHHSMPSGGANRRHCLPPWHASPWSNRCSPPRTPAKACRTSCWSGFGSCGTAHPGPSAAGKPPRTSRGARLRGTRPAPPPEPASQGSSSAWKPCLKQHAREGLSKHKTHARCAERASPHISSPHLFGSRHLLPRFGAARQAQQGGGGMTAQLVNRNQVRLGSWRRARCLLRTHHCHAAACLLGRRLRSRGGSPSSASALQGGRTGCPHWVHCRARPANHAPEAVQTTRSTCIRHAWRSAHAAGRPATQLASLSGDGGCVQATPPVSCATTVGAEGGC